MPGAPLIVTGRSQFEGPVHLEANGDRLVLGNNLASEIYVEAIEPA